MPPLKPPLPPPSPCQIITQSLSPNSCSSSTVNLLNETLFPRAAASATAGGKTPSAQLTSKKLVATRAQQTTSDSSNAPLLSVIDRSRLAIEVINSILRTLSDITKSTVTRLYPPSPSVDKLRTQVAGRLGTKVLQSRSGNSSDSALGSTDTIDHLADCCSISISFLISMESTEGVPNMQPLQTENARLSLSSKLIQLGRFERALNELKKLKWRLQLAMDIGNGIESWLIDAYDTKEEKMAMQKAIGKVLTTSRVGKENAVHVDSKAESEELSTLLEFPHISASSSAFPLVISFQLGVMRCITGLKRVEVIEVIVPSLSSLSSPLAFIKALAKSSPSKALSHVCVLSQILVSLTPTIAINNNTAASHNQALCTPNSMITLQALQIECLALQQTLRPDEQPKNLWGTFEKYLATYLRRTQSPERKSKSERYLFVRDVVGKMKKLLNCKDEKELLPLEVYKLICLAASDANLTNESIRWTEDWLIALERVDDNANAALAVLCKVRLAVLELKSLRLAWVGGTVLDTKWLESLEAKVSVAVKELENVARGRKQDVKSLLQETGQLRRSCLGLWTSLDHDGSKIADSSAHLDRSVQVTKKKVRFICDQAFKSVVQFCCKYMSMGISEEEHNQLQLILIPAIDTILSTRLSGFDTECPESWENAEPLLCECSAAVKIMDRERPGCIDRFYEKLSNVYYQIYLLYRKSPSSESKAARALRRSISIMDQRPTSELMTASVSRKYQVLGSSYLAARDYRRSEDAFLLSIKTAVATGLLNRLEELATHGESVRQLINSSDKEIAMVGAVLTGLVKIASRKNDGVATELRLDNIGLTVAIRGLLLEWTLSLALDQRDGNGSVVRAIGERLLDIYELEEMPIRRSRVIAKLLELSVDQPTLLDLEAMQGLGEEVLEWANSVSSSDLDADTSLQAFKDDIVARCSIGLGFSAWVQGSSQPELVWNAFRLWNGIIQLSGSWHSILNRIYNAQKVIKRLEMAVAFFDLKGEADLKLAALELLLKFRNLERPVNYNALITTYTRLGLQYLRLGYSGKAGMSIGKAQVWLKKSEDNITTATKLELHLAYTEYLVGIGNLEKGLKCFDAANTIASQDKDLSSAKRSDAKITERVKVNMTIADAAYVTSLIAFEKGNANESLLHARRCVRLNSRAWAGLENLGKDSASKRGQITDSLSANMQALSLTGSNPWEYYSTSHDALNLPQLWPLVSSLHLGYIQAANIYRHLGMIRESSYFMNHALKTVEAVDAKLSIDQTKVMFGDLKVRSGEIQEGSVMLENVGQSIGGGRAMVSFQTAVGNLERLNGNLEAEMEAYRCAEKAIDSLVMNTMDKARKISDSELPGQIDQLRSRVTEKTPSRRPKTPTRRGGRATKALRSTVTKSSPTKEVSPIESECTTLLKQKGDIQRLIARSMAVQGECESATETLERAAKLPAGNQEIIFQGLVEAINHLQKAFSLVSSDPVFSSLQESTISLPSIALSLEFVRSNIASPVKKSTRKAIVKKTKAFIEVLEQARDCLLKVHTEAMKSGSSTTIPRVASLLTSIIVLLSAMTDLKGRGPEHPLFASYSLELQKGLATQREKLVVETEKHGAMAQETLQWPEISASCVTTAILDAVPFEFSSFQTEYIDIIPKEWAAVSVTMSENRKELYITRFQTGQSQLMVRLPLNRHNSRDDYLDLIEYDAVMEELNEIIQRSNTSTHQAKYMENKADRAQWWSERQDLDDQMKVLLEGIERAWLGGFKGIFIQYSKNPVLFARFKASFDKILSKIPSRKRKKAGKVNIDYRILELFIALGNPEGQDLDEALTDLIFFVVDILQFHGEGNAYDEIDIDSMVIAMTAALSAYHDEAAFSPEEVEVEVDHIILILDKSVQMLPWESMPCLRGHSVSRLPSLAALRNRIVQMQQTSIQPSRPGHYITRKSGGYILNPDSDLKNTQKIFENDLKALPGQWTGIINRSPTEEEFKEILVKSDVLLYFGHGSGSHYIPARTIRKLDRCAVACLMGCSSGSLKDAGEFEPYGMPINYLLAGCPTVLANLWDVTDKDIDRFTKEVFDKWGLLRNELEEKRGGNKQRNSLVEAVAAARNKCVMKYLNGAAPVVYGIPAYFG